MRRLLGALCLIVAPAALAQTCPPKNLLYWQAFPAGGESDISARHQQLVLKKKCPSIETIIQYKPGAGGGLMWSQMNSLLGDGLNIVGINLPHIVLAPFLAADSAELVKAVRAERYRRLRDANKFFGSAPLRWPALFL